MEKGEGLLEGLLRLGDKTETNSRRALSLFIVRSEATSCFGNFP